MWAEAKKWLFFAFLSFQLATFTHEATDEFLTWRQASDPMALCNDFTRAGFFISRNTNTSDPASRKWVIFLESGTLCFSNETCNRRWFNSETREFYNNRTPESAQSFPPFGRFNPREAWDGTVNNLTAPQDHENVVNPLMSSMQCFNTSRFFPDGLQISGRDFMDRNPDMNKLFPRHNHIIIPYCSSDLWLGEETSGNECSCFDRSCFDYQPLHTGLQFTFRGKTIFQSIFQQLLSEYNMNVATEVVLAGSSAGGVGVVNHAQWVQGQISSMTNLLVLFDSAWFVNFQNSIFRIFDGTQSQAQSQQDTSQRLLRILTSNAACNDTTLGYPCCVSAHCMFTTTNSSGAHLYFPSDVRVFALTSIYDIFLLAPAGQQIFEEDLLRQENAPRNLGSTEADQEAAASVSVDFFIDFLRLAGEYGGVMNTTLIDAANRFGPNLAFYLPQCVQHIYFATSTLHGSSRQNVLGNGGVDLDLGTTAVFTHNISSGRWNTNLLATFPPGAPQPPRDITIQDALVEWYNERNTSDISPYRYRATCQGPYCYQDPIGSSIQRCPDEFALVPAGDNSWPVWAKILIAALIIFLSLYALFMKVLFVIWLYRLESKQNAYLDRLDEKLESDSAVLGFPVCEEEDAISVSCLDIHYSVTFRAKKAVKDEKKDQTAPIVLNNIAESSSESEEEQDDLNRSSRLFSVGRASARWKRKTRRGTRRLTRISTQFNLPDFSQITTSKERRKSSAAAELKRKRFSKGSISPQVGRKGSKKLIEQSTSITSTESQMSAMTEPVERKKLFGYRQKEILKQISVYFNPGEMVAVMGPSGCGKTTFLDLMTGRRKTGEFHGEIYVNGIPMDEIRDWYIANTGYVLQLATPYYEELTVRENVTLAAMIKLPRGFTLREKFERTEQVLEVTGLSKLAETVVGGATGPGLSGGQKRRLAVALQLLKLPSVIFLDEPTSGLDATGSFELLSHLNKLADSNRAIILTIHQPRLEIFHMFDRLVLLSDGRVAYHGAPEKAYEVFVNALTSRYLEQGLLIPELEDHNPADVIMDMLGNQKMRQIITENYHMSDEPQKVRRAITAARWKEYSTSMNSVDSISASVSYALFGSKRTARRQPDTFTRMATLEARGAKRGFNFFLPFMFFAFGFVLGTVYLQQSTPFLIISGVCVFSVASGLFMFPAMYPYYQRALQVYTYERADGVGRSIDLVMQGFIRFSSLSLLPAILSATVLYLMLINYRSYSAIAYLQVVLTNIALSQCWITLLIALICALPNSAFRVSSGISAVAGFTSGFFIPIRMLGWWWRWLVYINPNYYAVSSVAVFVLTDLKTDCPGSEFGCFLQSGNSVLRQFNFDDVNPYLHLVIILSFTLFYLLLAIFVNWIRHTSISSKLKRLKAILCRKSSDTLAKDFEKNPEEFARSFSFGSTLDEEPRTAGTPPTATTPLTTIPETEESRTCSPVTPHTKAVNNWKAIKDRTMTMLEEEEEPSAEISSPELSEGATASGWAKVKKVRINEDSKPLRPTKIPLKDEEDQKSAYLRDGAEHKVWRPKKAPQLADLVSDLLKKEKATKTSPEPNVATTPSASNLRVPALTPGAVSRGDLKARQKSLFHRVQATQDLLRETTDELLRDDDEDEQPKQHLSLLEASKKITANIKKQRSAENAQKGDDFSSVVRKCLAQVRKQDSETEGQTVLESSSNSNGLASGLRNRRGSKRGGAVPLKKWKNLARQETKGRLFPTTAKNPVYDRTMSEYPLNSIAETEEATAVDTNGHKPLGRSTSDTMGDQSSFGVTLVQPAKAERHSPMDITLADITSSPPPESHQPLVKKDSHSLMKPSKLAQVKGAVGRRGSAGLPRQTPIDVEASLPPLSVSPIPLVANSPEHETTAVEMDTAGDYNVLLSDPPRGKRKSSSGSLGEHFTSTML